MRTGLRKRTDPDCRKDELCPGQKYPGQKYVPELDLKDLSQIVLEMLASMNSLQRDQERLIDISADGEIQSDELEDFVRIQENLERMAMTVDTLQLWSEEMLSSGRIDKEAYEKLKAARG